MELRSRRTGRVFFCLTRAIAHLEKGIRMNNSINKKNLCTYYALKEEQFFKAFAKDYLCYLGNSKPTPRQLSEIQNLLSQSRVKNTVHLDNRLSDREKQCLYLSAFGRSIKEIADFLDVSERQVGHLRNSIFQKLDCKNITESVTRGLRFGEIRPPAL